MNLLAAMGFPFERRRIELQGIELPAARELVEFLGWNCQTRGVGRDGTPTTVIKEDNWVVSSMSYTSADEATAALTVKKQP